MVPLSSRLPWELAQVAREMVEAGETYQAIADHLTMNGVPTSEASVRRWRKSGMKDETPPDEVEVETSARIEHLESELERSHREIQKLRKNQNRDVALGAAVVGAVKTYFDGGNRLTVGTFVSKAGDDTTPQEFLAHISDLHYGEVVDPDLAMGLSYGPEVARRRMMYLRDKIIRYAELRPYEIGTLHVAVLGDMVSGIQHADLETTNARGMMDQALDVADMLYQMIQDFTQHFPKVNVAVITGNHGRMHKDTRHKKRYENWDYLSGRVLETMCSMGLDNRVAVTVPRGSRHIMDVCGRRVAIMHGDGVKAQNFAGIPWYSLKTKRDAMQSLLRSLDLPAVDQISMGHFHVPAWMPGECSVLMNGSVKGGDEFVMDTRLNYTPPVQLLQEWHPKFGVTAVDHIELGHIV